MSQSWQAIMAQFPNALPARTILASVEATCTCGWKCGEWNALAAAIRHARATGHHVTVDRKVRTEYNPVDSDAETQ